MATILAGIESGRKLQIRTLDVDGQVIRVGIKPGNDDGPPLLVFNGIGANLELVDGFAAALGDIGVIVFDIPGVGGSPAPLLPYRFANLCVLADRVLDHLGVDGLVDVLGVSWGGALAQEFAHLYPGRCRRLVLAATSPGVIMVPGSVKVLSKMVGTRRYADLDYLRRHGGEIYGGAFREDPDLLEEHGRHMQAPRGRGYVYQLLATWGWSSLLWLGALKQPTLVLHGTDDPIIPLINARIMAARIPQGRLHVFDDGHLFLLTRADEVSEMLHEFLRG